MLRKKAQILVVGEDRKIPGILSFDGRTLTFKSTDFYHPVERNINANEIVQTGARQNFFFFNRFFYVRLRDGRKYRFYTWYNKEFVRKINRTIHSK